VQIDPDDLSRPEIAELLKEHLTSMFVAAVLFSIAGAFAACGFFGPQEQVRQEPGRTTYRVPEGNSLEPPDITPVQEKVPGESR
jgi:hypothetical protein